MLVYNNMLNTDSSSFEKTFYRQGMTATILLAGPTYQEMMSSYRTACEEPQKTQISDPEIKKENQSHPFFIDKTVLTEKRRNSKVKKDSKSTKSFNHNFQKHTVITIKKLGRRMCQHFGKSLVQSLASQMWNIFQSCGISSKKILVVLFGAANFNQQKSKELFQSCCFGQICKYNDEIVRAAQNLLRIRFLELANVDLIRSHILRGRKICQRDQFMAYFNEFSQLLRQGPLTKFRLNPETTHHIEQIIREHKMTKTNIKRQAEAVYRTH